MDPSQEKAEVCDICGDIGVDNAILICTLCKINCEHMYCMKVPLEEAIDDWICEDCKFVHEPEPQASSMPTEVPKTNSVEVGKSGAESRKTHNESRAGQSTGNWEKRVEKGKTKYLPVKEAIMLSSGEKTSCSPVRFNWRSKPKGQNTGNYVSERTAIRSKPMDFSSRQDVASGSSKLPKLLRPDNLKISKKQHSTKLTDVPRPVGSLQSSQSPRNTDILKELQKETQWAQTKARRAVKKPSSKPSLNAPLVTISGGDIYTSSELRMGDAENTNSLPDSEKRLRAPALVALWKGSFKIHDDDRQEELTPQIQAYPPSRVLKKIYRFSKEMPQELRFELVCAKTFWTNLFCQDIPDVRDIALYFFPSTGQRSEDYICLLESISLRDLALRVQIGDVELLVFTSKRLPVDYQCLDGKNFLWGVFHRLKKETTSCLDKRVVEVSVQPSGYAHDELDDREEIDMDIDMIGGTEVGRIDVPVEKGRPAPSVRVKMEMHDLLIPPGFEEVFKLRFQNSSPVPR